MRYHVLLYRDARGLGKGEEGTFLLSSPLSPRTEAGTLGRVGGGTRRASEGRGSLVVRGQCLDWSSAGVTSGVRGRLPGARVPEVLFQTRPVPCTVPERVEGRRR